MLKLAMLPLIAAGFLVQPPSSQNPPKPVDFKKTIAPFVKKYCAPCHSGPNAKQGIDFSKFKTQADVDKNTRIWRRAGKEVAEGQMPPSTAALMPKDAEKSLFSAWCAALPK